MTIHKTNAPTERRAPNQNPVTVGRIVTWLLAVFIIVPVLATFIAATSVDFSKGPWGGGFTLDWFVLGWNLLGSTLLRSLLVALLVVALNLLIVFPLAWWAPRLPDWVARVLITLSNIPLAIPGIALSIALIGTFSGLRPSGILLVVGHLIFTLPFAMSALVPALADPLLREAEYTAHSLGASWLRAIFNITIPWTNVAILQAVTMIFAISFGEFNISFFINPPATPMAPFALFDAYSTRRLEVASAMSCLFIAFAIPVLAAIVAARTRSNSRAKDK